MGKKRSNKTKPLDSNITKSGKDKKSNKTEREPSSSGDASTSAHQISDFNIKKESSNSKPEKLNVENSNKRNSGLEKSMSDEELPNWDENVEYNPKPSTKDTIKHNNKQDSKPRKQNHDRSLHDNSKDMEQTMHDDQGTSSNWNSKCHTSDVWGDDNFQDSRSRNSCRNISKQRRITEYGNCATSKTIDIEFDKFESQYIRSCKDMDFKIVEEMFGDLFTAGPEYSLGHCVAEDMAMGSGIAVTFRRDFKRVDELLNQRKRQGDVAILQDKERYIYYLVTKRQSSKKPTYHSLWWSLHQMRNHIISHDVKKLALPRIGCGLDGLEWDCVKKMLETIFQGVDIHILIYNFQQDESDTTAPNRLRKCHVVNVAYPISQIEDYTIIVYFGSEDGHVTPELNTIAEKFPFVIQRYRMEKKELGKPLFINKYNDGYAFFGCIVRKKYSDPIDFVHFQKCLNVIQSQNRKDKYPYVAFQAFVEANDNYAMDVTKIVNLMRYALTNVDVYVCWPKDLETLMPRF